MWCKSAFIRWIGFYFWQEHDVSNREYQWRQRRREGKSPADEMKKLLTPLLLLLFVVNAAATDFPDVINTNEV